MPALAGMSLCSLLGCTTLQLVCAFTRLCRQALMISACSGNETFWTVLDGQTDIPVGYCSKLLPALACKRVGLIFHLHAALQQDLRTQPVLADNSAASPSITVLYSRGPTRPTR